MALSAQSAPMCGTPVSHERLHTSISRPWFVALNAQPSCTVGQQMHAVCYERIEPQMQELIGNYSSGSMDKGGQRGGKQHSKSRNQKIRPLALWETKYDKLVRPRCRCACGDGFYRVLLDASTGEVRTTDGAGAGVGEGGASAGGSASAADARRKRIEEAEAERVQREHEQREAARRSREAARLEAERRKASRRSEQHERPKVGGKPSPSSPTKDASRRDESAARRSLDIAQQRHAATAAQIQSAAQTPPLRSAELSRVELS